MLYRTMEWLNANAMRRYPFQDDTGLELAGGVAAALTDGMVGLRHFTDAAIRREDILALAQRVDTSVDADIEREWGRNVSPAALRIEMNDGTAYGRISSTR